MKNNNINKENVDLVQTFVDIVNKDKLSELEYEADGLKIKIVSRSLLQEKPENQIIQKIEKQAIDVSASSKKSSRTLMVWVSIEHYLF